MNQAILYGKVLSEPILRKTDNDKSVCNFTISTKNGKYGYDKVPCICWGIVAENFVKYMTKNGIILIAKSRISSRTVTIATGFSYEAVTVVAEVITYVQSGHKEEGSKGELGVKDPITEVSVGDENEDPFEAASTIEIGDDDLPF